jgi:hypothetical protein
MNVTPRAGLTREACLTCNGRADGDSANAVGERQCADGKLHAAGVLGARERPSAIASEASPARPCVWMANCIGITFLCVTERATAGIATRWRAGRGPRGVTGRSVYAQSHDVPGVQRPLSAPTRTRYVSRIAQNSVRFADDERRGAAPPTHAPLQRRCHTLERQRTRPNVATAASRAISPPSRAPARAPNTPGSAPARTRYVSRIA